MADHTELIEKLWLKYVKPMKLPPRLSGDVKHAMSSAALSSSGDSKTVKKSIRQYLKDRGYDPETGAKVEGAPKPAKGSSGGAASTATPEAPKKKKKDRAPEATASADPAKDALGVAGAAKALKGNDETGVPAGNIDLRQLKRPTLKGMALDLGAKYKKRWTDDELRAKVAAKMIGLDSTAKAAIAAADPAKIEKLGDCVGLMLDLTKAICITCPAQADCRKLFEQHRQTGFKVFDSLKGGDTAAIGSNNGNQIAVKVSSPEVRGTVAVAKSSEPTKIEVLDVGKVSKLAAVKVDGADVSNEDHKEFLIAVKKAKPASLDMFKVIVLDNYDVGDGGTEQGLVTWFTKYCIALGLIKLS